MGADTAEAAFAMTREARLWAAEDVLIDDAFPDWRRVIPEFPAEPAGSAAYSTQLVAEIARSHKAVVGEARGMQITHGTGYGPALIRFSEHHMDEVRFFAALMSMRPYGDDLDKLPDWFAEPPRKRANRRIA